MVLVEASCEVLKKLTSCHWDVTPQAVYICQSCQFSSTSKLELIFHLYSTHLQNACLLTLECKSCGFSSLSEKEMFLHEKNRHGVSADDNISFSKDIDIRFIINEVYCHRETGPSRNQNQKTYQCFDCNFETSHLNRLEEHSSKHPDSSFKCSEHENLQDNCLKCIYKKFLSKLSSPSETATIHNEDTASVDEMNGNKPLKQPQKEGKFKCFHCGFVASSRFLLKSHASKHYNQKFKCRLHYYSPSDRCDSCQYRFILEEVNKELFFCQECDFKTFIERTFLKHQKDKCRKSADIEDASDSGNIGLAFKCFDCDYTTWRKDFLKNHAVDHKFSTFTCSDHRQVVDNCLKCVYKGCLLNCQPSNGQNKTEVSENTIGDVNENTYEHGSKTNAKIAKNNNFEDESLSEEKNAKTEKFTCFDCDYKSAKKSLLIQHAMHHENSTFKCPDHEKISVSCPKCIYRSCLMELPLKIKKCNDCGYRTTRNARFAEHQCTNKATSDSFKYKCYHCGFKTIRKDLLLEHAILHENRIFNCPNHDKITDNCPKCVYQRCLTDVPLKIKKCDHCGYKTTRSDHQCRNTSFKCFDCDYEGTKQELLLQHAIQHENSTFHCPDHRDIIIECPKCVYQKCLMMLPLRLKQCDECGYKTTRTERFASHQCHTQNERCLKCFHCDYSTYNKVQLQIHAKIHQGSSFKCVKHDGGNTKCLKCIYQDCLQKEYEFKCFDCNYKTAQKSHLLCHALAHENSGFNCPDHNEMRSDCSKCVYRDVLDDLPFKKRVCNDCGYKTCRNDRFLRHDCKKTTDSNTTQHELFKCFDCDFKSSRKIQLWRHVEVHENSNFCCPDHNEIKADCLGCVYKSCLEDLPRRMQVCDSCDYTTCRNDVFVKHRCSKPKNSNKEIVKEAYKCRNCNFKASERDVLDAHQAKCRAHMDSESPDVVLIEDVKIEVADPLEGNEAGNTINEEEDSAAGSGDEASVTESRHKRFKCFDCDYKASKKEGLLLHAVMHENSDFSCPDHKKMRRNCPKCIYKSVLEKLPYKMRVCDRCGYKTCRDDYFAKHRCFLSKTKRSDKKSTSFNIENFRCRLCSFEASSLQTLKQHASLKHLGENFECNLHQVAVIAKCKDCFYEIILKEIEKEAYKCQNCDFKALEKAVLDAHHCRAHMDSESPLVVSDEDVKIEVADTLEDPIDSETGKTINEEEDSAAGSGDEASKTERNILAHNKIFKCFDCEYEAPRKDYLVRHVVWHENSNFYCTDHNEIKTDCPKCVYKSVLNDLPRKMRVCDDCGYKTCQNDKFVKHRCSKSERSNNQSPSFDIGNFKCSLCSFKASSLQTLKQHASLKHLDEYFECDLHRHAKAASCRACSFEVMLKEIENKAYKCRNCDFKALERAAVHAHQGKCRKRMHSESSDVSGEDVNIEAADSLEDDTTPEANGKQKHVAGSADEASVTEAHGEGIHKSSFNALSLKCFECARFSTNDIEKLKQHSIVHSRSTFQCDIHETPELNHECNKCVYVSLKLSAKNDAFVCQVCDFLTLEQDVFREHQKHCGIGQVSTIIDITEEESDLEISNDAGAVEGRNLEYGIIEHYDYHCYDCAGQKFRETACFEQHVKSHNESSYKCPDHLIFTVYCKKCVYQYALMGLKLGKYICKYCSFKDAALEPVLIHMRGNCMANAHRKAVGHMCFHCGSKSESREALSKHSLQHHSNYVCLEHHMKKKKTCPKCFYAYLIAKNNRDKTVTCGRCERKFKSSFDLWMHVENRHEFLFWTAPRKVPVKEHLCDCKNCQLEHKLKKASMPTRRKCPLCKHYYISNRDTTKRHLEIKHQTGTYHCIDHLSEKQYAYCYHCCVERLLQLMQGGVREKVCCECNYICEELEDLVFHVVVHHFDSTFQCSEHFLSEIDPACDMCVYESIVLCIE